MEGDFSSIKNLSNNISFIRWVKGTARPEEMRRWEQWINESPENKQLVMEAQQKVLGMDFVNTSEQDLSQEWNQLEKRIWDSQKQINFTLSRFNHKKKTNWLLRIAAVLLIAALTGLTAAYYGFTRAESVSKQENKIEWKTIETDYRQLKTIALSDGSTITLNANSSITYPAGWVRGNVTEVYLEGEAYFSITSRKAPKAPPFEVKTEDGTVKVMGTKFVVKSNSENTRVALEEGAITILRNGINEQKTNQQQVCELKPGNLATFSKGESSITVSEVSNMTIFTSWKDSELVLDSSPFRYLVERIKHTYGVNVKILNEQLYNRKLTGTIKLKDLEYLAKSISEVMDTEVSLSDNTVYFGNINH